MKASLFILFFLFVCTSAFVSDEDDFTKQVYMRDTLVSLVGLFILLVAIFISIRFYFVFHTVAVIEDQIEDTPPKKEKKAKLNISFNT